MTSGARPVPPGTGSFSGKGLDVRDDPERQARAVRPGDPGSSIDRNIGKRPGALRLHVTYGVEPAAARRRLTSAHSAGGSGPCSKATLLSWRWAGSIVPTMVVAMSGVGEGEPENELHRGHALEQVVEPRLLPALPLRPCPSSPRTEHPLLHRL